MRVGKGIIAAVIAGAVLLLFIIGCVCWQCLKPKNDPGPYGGPYGSQGDHLNPMHPMNQAAHRHRASAAELSQCRAYQLDMSLPGAGSTEQKQQLELATHLYCVGGSYGMLAVRMPLSRPFYSDVLVVGALAAC